MLRIQSRMLIHDDDNGEENGDENRDDVDDNDDRRDNNGFKTLTFISDIDPKPNSCYRGKEQPSGVSSQINEIQSNLLTYQGNYNDNADYSDDDQDDDDDDDYNICDDDHDGDDTISN